MSSAKPTTRFPSPQHDPTMLYTVVRQHLRGLNGIGLRLPQHLGVDQQHDVVKVAMTAEAAVREFVDIPHRTDAVVGPGDR
jgi:hypothetical protein